MPRWDRGDVGECLPVDPAALDFCRENGSLQDRTVAIQGAGAVDSRLARKCVEAVPGRGWLGQGTIRPGSQPWGSGFVNCSRTPGEPMSRPWRPPCGRSPHRDPVQDQGAVRRRRGVPARRGGVGRIERAVDVLMCRTRVERATSQSGWPVIAVGLVK